MTVKELIDYLWKCNQDYEVVIDGDGEIAYIVEHRGITDVDDNRVTIWVKYMLHRMVQNRKK